MTGFMRLNMQPLLFGQQLVYGFPVHFVRNTAIHGAYRRALGFFVKALAFRTLIGNDVVGIDADGGETLSRVHRSAVKERKAPLYGRPVGYSPFHAAFINRIVGAFWLAGPAINAFFGDLNRHTINFAQTKIGKQSEFTTKN
jgi:hypothetical protein